MPKQKDLKRIVRSRMQKTGESYTAARLHVVHKQPANNFAALAGMTDASVMKATGRDWASWVKVLDAENSTSKPHREIAQFVSSLGVPSWWTQTVTVGYERIRGLRDRNQRRGGGYEANKSRTFAVPVAEVFDAFTKPRVRSRWLPGVRLSGATPHKRLRLRMPDDTPVEVGFTAKGDKKCSVAVQHSKLADKAAAMKMKEWWAERFDALGEMLG